MNRGSNDLLDEAYRRLVDATATSSEWIVVGICVVALVIVGVFA